MKKLNHTEAEKKIRILGFSNYSCACNGSMLAEDTKHGKDQCFSEKQGQAVTSRKITPQAEHKHIRCDIAKTENWICCICRGCACQVKPQAGEECSYEGLHICKKGLWDGKTHTPPNCTPTEEGDRCICFCHTIDKKTSNDMGVSCRHCKKEEGDRLCGCGCHCTEDHNCGDKGCIESCSNYKHCIYSQPPTDKELPKYQEEFYKKRLSGKHEYKMTYVSQTDKGGGWEERLFELINFRGDISPDNARDFVAQELASQKSQIVEVLEGLIRPIDLDGLHEDAHKLNKTYLNAIQKISGGEK